MTFYEYQTSDNYDDIIKSHENVLVDFYAQWCGPCAEILNVINSEVSKGKNNLKIVKVDMDDNADLGENLELPGIPYVIFYKNGQKKIEFYGKQWEKLTEIFNSI